MHNAQTDTTAQNLDSQALDLTQLDEQAYQRFMKELLADLAHQRRVVQAWRLPTLVMPLRACAMA